MSLDLRNARNSKIQGDIGLAHAILWFEQQGFHVYLPLTDSHDADLVADINGNLCKVQVKTTYYKTKYGIYAANLLVSGGNRSGTGKIKVFEPGKVDFLFVVTDAGDMYLIPSVVIEAKKALSLGAKCEPYRVHFKKSLSE